jgi:hypothetical protein
MPFRTPAFFRRREEQPAAPGRVDGDDAMLDAAPPPHAGAPAGAGRGDGDAHAAALAADVLPDKAAIGSALGSLGAPPLFPLLPREELMSDEERAVRLQGFGAFGCAAAKRGGKASHSLHRVVAGQYSRPRTPLPLRRCKHYHRRARLVVPCCKGEARGARGWRPRGAASSRAVARCLTLPLARLASARARRLSGAATATTSARTAPSAATATPSGAPRRPGARACARTPQLRAAPRRTAAPHAPHAPPAGTSWTASASATCSARSATPCSRWRKHASPAAQPSAATPAWSADSSTTTCARDSSTATSAASAALADGITSFTCVARSTRGAWRGCGAALHGASRRF